MCKHSGVRIYRAGNGGQAFTDVDVLAHQVQLPKLGVCSQCLLERLEAQFDISKVPANMEDPGDSEDMGTFMELLTARRFQEKLDATHQVVCPIITTS